MSNPKKILIVDDDQICLQALAIFLGDAGYDYLTADHGREAWELLQQTPDDFALVIADRIMPHLHGVDLLLQMQTHLLLKTIPLILVTGEVEKDEIIAALRAGIFELLYKPVTKDTLLPAIKRALHKH